MIDRAPKARVRPGPGPGLKMAGRSGRAPGLTIMSKTKNYVKISIDISCISVVEINQINQRQIFSHEQNFLSSFRRHISSKCGKIANFNVFPIFFLFCLDFLGSAKPEKKVELFASLLKYCTDAIGCSARRACLVHISKKQRENLKSKRPGPGPGFCEVRPEPGFGRTLEARPEPGPGLKARSITSMNSGFLKSKIKLR